MSGGHRNVEREAICVPIVAQVWFSILAEARKIAELKVDMAEWRVDYFAGHPEEIPEVIKELRTILEEKQLIVTLRSTAEGGEENGDRFDSEALAVSAEVKVNREDRVSRPMPLLRNR